MVKVVIVEDHDLARMGLEGILSKNPDIKIAGTAADGQDGVDMSLNLKPDVVLMDIGLPTIDGIEATRKIKNANPLCVLCLSQNKRCSVFITYICSEYQRYKNIGVVI